MMSVLNIIVPVIISAALTALMVPLIIRLSYRKKLCDTIDERTVHSGIIPRLGGGAFILSVVVAVAIAVLMFDGDEAACRLTPKSNWVQYGALIGSAMIIFVAGLWDDIRRLNSKMKFLCQLVSAVLVVLVGGFWISDFHGLLGIWSLPPVVGKGFTVLLIMYVINAFNLIDGIDGLASSLGFVASLVIGVILLLSGQELMAVLSFALAASLAVFFCFNKFGSIGNRTKIFMGDGGSQTMGLIVAFLVVFMSSGEPHYVSDNPAVQSPVVPFCLIIIPCFDAVRVMVGRMLRGNNPFLPDKTHIHHEFLRIGFSASRTLVVLLLLDVCLIVVNIVLALADINFDANINADSKLETCVRINIILVLDILIWLCINRWLNHRISVVEGKDNR